MRWGILLVAIGIACYIVHAMLLNHYLRKHAPEVLARDPGVPSQRQRREAYSFLADAVSSGLAAPAKKVSLIRAMSMSSC